MKARKIEKSAIDDGDQYEFYDHVIESAVDESDKAVRIKKEVTHGINTREQLEAVLIATQAKLAAIDKIKEKENGTTDIGTT